MIGLQTEGSVVAGTPSASPRSASGGSARERAQQAVEFYNNSVLRARVGAGLVGPRASYSDRHQHPIQGQGQRRHCQPQDVLYRSNSSLELMQDHHSAHNNHQESVTSQPSAPPLRREYGSHGSIDALLVQQGASANVGTSESFFAMLQDYRPAVLSVISADQRSPGPSEYLRGKVEGSSNSNNDNSMNFDDQLGASNDRLLNAGASPKLRLKLQRLWGGNAAINNSATKSPRHIAMDDSAVNTSTVSVSSVTSSSADIEERQRRRAFAHYDCQSLTANLGYAAKLRGLLLARRRNTTTGASAASMVNTRSSTPDGDSGDEDYGDGHGNDLLESCPFFRNEIGGEEERVVSLSRVSHAPSSYGRCGSRTRGGAIHRPPMAYGVAILEYGTGDTFWRHSTCPYQRLPRPIETRDQGALYYREHFYGQEHQNWFGMDEQLGPVGISFRRERIDACQPSHTAVYQYRLVIRTSELLTLRGSVLEDAIPNARSGSGGNNGCGSKGLSTKEVLEYVAPEIQLSCLRLGVSTPQCEEQLLKLDEQGLTNHYKIGIMYCRQGQYSEEDMYNNEDSGPAFDEFLDTIGTRVRLKGFDKYKAGLDNKTDSTGLYSVYANYQDCEVMFHVSTLLPFTPNNRQQLLRKRHIGNDIVTIVFQEPGAQPFTPKNIRSQFQHVFVIVRVINPCTENTHYSVAVSRSKEVPVFGPPIKTGAVFPKGKSFADFLLAKVVNAENAAHRSEKFATMATRTRQEYLKDMSNNYTSTVLVDTGQKFSIFSSKKKDRPRPRFIGDSTQRGAICWQVVLDDSGQSATVDCFLGISTDTLVLIEECSRQIVFVTPCKSILGWSANTNSLRIYHHQGECVTLHMRDSGDRDEQMEIIIRLRAVTTGCMTQELSLRRNNMGQLGFHVQPDGVVTQVENNGLAWSAGLRQGARLVEICKVAVATLSHDQMVDLLKTSMLVTVTVIPANADGSARRGCSLQNCKYIAGNYEGDYENISSPEDNTKGHKKGGAQMQLASNHRRKYERSFSPPRSSNSSGYGTGSSSKSFTDHRFVGTQEGTITSTSSGHSDDRWYELLEPAEQEQITNTNGNSKTPPPLPNRALFQNSTPKRMEAVQQVNMHHSHLNHNNLHNKVQGSHSVPLVHGNLSLISNNNIHYDFEVNEFKLPDKVMLKGNANESRPLPRTANIEYLGTRTGKSSADVEPAKTTDGYSDTSSISDRLAGIHSEDESTDCGNTSPRLKRSGKHRGTLTPCSNNSRNQSPRPSGETKLRAGITNRHANRHSANLNSTLQEDLMKLINPDYIPEDKLTVQKKKESCSMVNISSIAESKRTRGNKDVDKNVRQSQSNHSLKNESEAAEVIFTMARPATVISNASTASSPNPSEMKMSKEERLSPRVTNLGKKMSVQLNPSHEPMPLPDAREMDWPSLVDTATRAMLQVKEEPEHPQATSSSTNDLLTAWPPEDATNSSVSNLNVHAIPHSSSVPELQSHLTHLETQVARETRQRLSLEDEVRRLRDENRRLHDESQTAAQQLRRFTEWFFQTIDRQ